MQISQSLIVVSLCLGRPCRYFLMEFPDPLPEWERTLEQFLGHPSNGLFPLMILMLSGYGRTSTKQEDDSEPERDCLRTSASFQPKGAAALIGVHEVFPKPPRC